MQIPGQQQDDIQSRVDQMYKDITSWASGFRGRKERSDIDFWLSNLKNRPEDPSDEEIPAWTSQVGRRPHQVAEFAGGLSEEGKQYLGSKVQRALAADERRQLEEMRAEQQKWLKAPDFGDKLEAYLGPFRNTALDPIKGLTLGYGPSIIPESWEEGVNDAVLQVLVEEGRRKNIPEDELVDYAFSRMNENDLPGWMRMAHMSAMIPDIAYTLPAFVAAGAGAGAVAKIPAVARLGMSAESVAKYAKWFQKQGEVDKILHRALGFSPRVSKAGKVTGVQLPEFAQHARTFGVVSAARSREGQEGVSRWESFLQGASAGAVVGGLAHPTGRLLEKTLPDWALGKAWWQRVPAHRLEAAGVPKEVLKTTRPRFDRKTKEWVFRDGDKVYPVKGFERHVRETVGDILRVPDRFSEAFAFAGMAMTHGPVDAVEVGFNAAFGALTGGKLVPGLPRKLTRWVPMSRAWREDKGQREFFEHLEYLHAEQAAHVSEMKNTVDRLLQEADATSRETGAKPVKIVQQIGELAQQAQETVRRLEAEGKTNTPEYQKAVETVGQVEGHRAVSSQKARPGERPERQPTRVRENDEHPWPWHDARILEVKEHGRRSYQDRFSNVPEGWDVVFDKNLGGGKVAIADPATKTIRVNPDQVKKGYAERWWTRRIQGAGAMPRDAFRNITEWENFIVQHEIEHARTQGERAKAMRDPAYRAEVKKKGYDQKRELEADVAGKRKAEEIGRRTLVRYSKGGRVFEVATTDTELIAAAKKLLKDQEGHAGQQPDPVIKPPSLKRQPPESKTSIGHDVPETQREHLRLLFYNYAKIKMYLRTRLEQSPLLDAENHTKELVRRLDKIEAEVERVMKESGHEVSLRDLLEMEAPKDDPLFQIIDTAFPFWHKNADPRMDTMDPAQRGKRVMLDRYGEDAESQGRFRPRRDWMETSTLEIDANGREALQAHFADSYAFDEVIATAIQYAQHGYPQWMEHFKDLALGIYKREIYLNFKRFVGNGERGYKAPMAELHKFAMAGVRSQLQQRTESLDEWHEELAFRPSTPKESRMSRSAMRRMTEQLRDKVKQWFSEKLKKGGLQGEDLLTHNFDRIFQSSVNQEYRGKVILNLQKSSPEYAALPDAQKATVYQLFLDRLHRQMFPNARRRPGTTYAREAKARLIEQFKRLPKNGEILPEARQMRMDMEKHVQDMMREFRDSIELALIGVEKIDAPGPVDKFHQWVKDHPWKTGMTLAAGTGAAFAIGGPTIGASFMVGAPLSVIPWGNRIARGFRGTQDVRQRLIRQSNGFLRNAWDTLREEETGVTLQDFVPVPKPGESWGEAAKRGDLKGMKKFFASVFGLPEQIVGSPLVDGFANAYITSGTQIERDRVWMFGGVKDPKTGELSKGAFEGTEEGSPMSRLVGFALDGWRKYTRGTRIPYRDPKTGKRNTVRFQQMVKQVIRDIEAKENVKIDEAQFWRIFKKMRRYLDDRREEFASLNSTWMEKGQEWGVDDYFHHLFPTMKKEENWWSQLTPELKRLIRKPTPGTRDALLMHRGENKFDYDIDAIRGMRRYAPAARWIYQMQKMRDGPARDYLYGRWQTMGWAMRNAGEQARRAHDPEGPEGPGHLGARASLKARTAEKRELEALLEFQEPVIRTSFMQLGNEGVGGIRLSQKTIERLRKETLSRQMDAKRHPELAEMDTNTEWYMIRGFRASDEFITLVRKDKYMAEGMSDKPGKPLERGKLEGWAQEIHWTDMRDAQVRQGGMVTLRQKNRLEEAIKYVDYVSNPAREAYAGIWDKITGWLYHTTIGGLNPRPAMHNLIGGQWLNFTELGGKYWMTGAQRAFGAAVAAESKRGTGGVTGKLGKKLGAKASIEDLRLLQESGLFIESTYFGAEGTAPGLPALDGIKKLSFTFFRKAEDMNRAVAYLGAYHRSMDRMKLNQRHITNRTMDEHAMHQKAKADAIRAVGRTAAWYAAVNAPGIFRSPMGRMLMHLNRFSVMFANEAVRAWQDRSIRPGRLFRGIASGMVLYQLGQMFGQDLNFIFGQRVSDVGQPVLEEGLLGGHVPDFRRETPAMYQLLTQPHKTIDAYRDNPLGLVGDVILPFPAPYDWAPPVRLGLDMYTLLSGIVHDDAEFMDSFGYQMKYRLQKTMDMMVPAWSMVRRATHAGIAAAEEGALGLPKEAFRPVFGQMADLAKRPGGWFSLTIDPSDPKARYTVSGMRDRQVYRTAKEVLFDRLLMPGIPTQVESSIRQNMVERTRQRMDLENNQRGYDRIIAALEDGEWDTVEEQLELYNFRPQDIKRQWEMKNMVSWIRSLSGTTEAKLDAIYDRWLLGNTLRSELLEALAVHVNDIERTGADGLYKMMQILMDRKRPRRRAG